MGVYKGQQPNVFRAVSGSLFSTTANWSRGYVPTGSDVAMIADNCVIDVNRTIGSLVVRAPFTASINTGLTLNISQSINVLGHLSCSGTPTINILGLKNIINSLSPASSSFFYLGSTQTIPGVTYWTLSIRNPGIKTSNGTNTTILNLLNVRESATYDLANSNLIVSGTSRIGENAVNSGNLLKTGIGGSVLFVGRADFNNGSSVFSGNPRVELRNGLSYINVNPTSVNLGNNDLYFTTNNQSIFETSNFFNQTTTLFNPIYISGSITLTIDYPTTTLIINRPINGLSSNDILINKGRLFFNTAESVNTMLTGGFDYGTFNNTIGYPGNYSRTMLAYSSSYRNLYIAGQGVKTLPFNTSISGTLQLDSGGTLDMGNFDLIVSGTATIGVNAVSPGFLQKNTPGSIIFIGRPYFFYGFITLTNNPTVEFRNGIDANYTNVTLNSNNIRFTTNNQSIVNTTGQYNNVIISGSAIISGGINLTLTNNTYYFDGPINGFSASDTLTNSGSLYFTSPAALSGSLITGSANFSAPNNTVGFVGNYSATSSAKINTFFNLLVQGSGTKTLGTSSYVSGGLTINSPAILDLSNSNLIVSGTTNILNGSILQKSGSGNVIFNGPLWFNNAAFGNTAKLDFSRGNPTVEVRNGIQNSFNSFVTASMITGTGSWIFSTNNQTIGNGGTAFRFDSPIIISGSIAVTQSSFNNANQTIVNLYNTLNGTSPSSVYRMDGPLYLYYNSIPMITGSLDMSGPFANLGFMFSESINLPYATYTAVTIAGGGTSTKTITSSIYVSRSLTVNGASGSLTTLELGNYDLYVSGTTRLNYGKLSKSGPGRITFVGSFSTDTIAADQARLNLSGNPTVELQNGFGIFFSSWFEFNSGTGSWIFTTNNQSLSGEGNTNIVISGSIIVSGAINLTHNTINANGAILTALGPIDGTVAESRFTGRQTVFYRSSIQPMLTGSFDVSSSLTSTFIYASGSQDIRGGIYRNLTMLSGSKTLQGNVSVLGTLVTGSGAGLATVILNGFTLTNP